VLCVPRTVMSILVANTGPCFSSSVISASMLVGSWGLCS
jgi:hypothetical protein